MSNNGQLNKRFKRMHPQNWLERLVNAPVARVELIGRVNARSNDKLYCIKFYDGTEQLMIINYYEQVARPAY